MEHESHRLEIVAERYGTTVVSDGWKNCRRQPIINMVISSNGLVFIDCIDTKGHKKDVDFIVNFIQRGLIDHVPKCLKGTECLKVMDRPCTKALAILEKLLTHLVTAKCACHGLDLMLEKASLWKHVKDLLKLLTQIYLIFRFSDQGGPAMAVLDGKMREERETMVNFETNNFATDIRLRNCMKLYDVRLEWFRNHVHQVWYIVNPHYASKTNLSENN